jgi:chromosome segregation ATPase
MTDKNKRSAHATKTAGNTSRSAPEFSAALNHISTQLSELCSDSEGFKDYNKIHNSEKRLKSELEKKDQELQSVKDANEDFRKQNEELTNDKGVLKREFISSAAEWTTNKEELSQVKCLLEETQSKLKTANQQIRRLSTNFDSLQTELDKSQKDASSLKDRLESMNIELQKVQVDFQKAQLERRRFKHESEGLKDELGVIALDDEDRYESLKNPPRLLIAIRQSRLAHLALESHNLCRKQFFKNIHNPPVSCPLLTS